MAYDASSGATACSNYSSFTGLSTKWSTSSSIGSGTYLYNTQAGAETGDSGQYVTDGYYSNGANYYYFGTGTTATGGTSC